MVLKISSKAEGIAVQNYLATMKDDHIVDPNSLIYVRIDDQISFRI